jgi:hypothetical protein
MVASSTGNYKWWVCTYLLASLIIALGLPIFGNNNLQGNAALIWHRSDRTATYYSAADTAYYPYMEATPPCTTQKAATAAALQQHLSVDQ